MGQGNIRLRKNYDKVRPKEEKTQKKSNKSDVNRVDIESI